MIYCISDIHGRIDLFEQMLQEINLVPGEDMLYILGDTIDRGGGLKVLQKVMELHEQGVCKMIIGNHEIMFLNYITKLLRKDELIEAEKEIERIQYESREMNRKMDELREKVNSEERATMGHLFQAMGSCLKAFDNVSKIKDLNKKIPENLMNIRKMCSGETVHTWEDANEMSKQELQAVIDFLIHNTSLEERVTIGDKKYYLSHAGRYDCIIDREKFYNEPFSENEIAIFGHTTTRDLTIHRDGVLQVPFKIWYDEKYKDKIGIDCGASYPYGQLACLRLDDMKEFYVTNDRKTITLVSWLNDKYQEMIA